MIADFILKGLLSGGDNRAAKEKSGDWFGVGFITANIRRKGVKIP